MKKLTAIAMVLLVAALLAGCFGPKPQVVSYTWQPPNGDQPGVVEVVVKNSGPGDGEVLVEVDLKDKTSGDTIAHEEDKVQLALDETLHLRFDIDLPPSQQNIDPNNIAVDITAQYPVE